MTQDGLHPMVLTPKVIIIADMELGCGVIKPPARMTNLPYAKHAKGPPIAITRRSVQP